MSCHTHYSLIRTKRLSIGSFVDQETQENISNFPTHFVENQFSFRASNKMFAKKFFPFFCSFGSALILGKNFCWNYNWQLGRWFLTVSIQMARLQNAFQNKLLIWLIAPASLHFILCSVKGMVVLLSMFAKYIFPSLSEGDVWTFVLIKWVTIMSYLNRTNFKYVLSFLIIQMFVVWFGRQSSCSNSWIENFGTKRQNPLKFI